MDARGAVRVLIAEDHDIVRRCLSLAISRWEEFEVVGEAATAAEAKEKAAELQPDVVVLDAILPDETGVAAARAIRSRNPNVRVLVLTSYGDDRAVLCSIMAGALGYLGKQVRSYEIVEAVRRAGQGQALLDRASATQVLARLLSGLAQMESNEPTHLEHQIMHLVGLGRIDREIAEVVQLTEEQVAQHIGVILGKLEQLRRAQATAFLTERRARAAARETH